MKKGILAAVAVLVVVGGGYFGGQAMGLFGKKAMSAEEISTVLAARAQEINDSGALPYDGWSKLVSAVHVEKQLTVDAVSTLPLEKLTGGAEGYMESRMGQAANLLCNDETMKAALAGGARFVYRWKDSEGEVLGMVSAGGPVFCSENGY